MLTNEQLTLAKTQPREFLLTAQKLVIRLKRVMNELSFAEETGASKEEMRKLLDEVKAIKLQRDDINKLIAEKVSDDTYRYILTAHFLQDMTMPEISKSLNYSRRWAMRLQAKALKAFADAI